MSRSTGKYERLDYWISLGSGHGELRPSCIRDAYVMVDLFVCFRFVGLTEKPRVCISSAKLVGEGFEFMYKTLDEIYDDVVEYGRALGILPC